MLFCKDIHSITQLRNRAIPLMPPQVTSLHRNLDSNIPQKSSYDWSSPPQKPRLRSQNHDSAEKLRSAPVTKASTFIMKMNKPHPLPQSVRVLTYKLDSMDHYQKGSHWPSLSKLLKNEKEAQESQHLEKRYPSVNSQNYPPVPQTTMVNDSNTQEVLERSPHTQVMTTETYDRAQN